MWMRLLEAAGMATTALVGALAAIALMGVVIHLLSLEEPAWASPVTAIGLIWCGLVVLIMVLGT